MISGLDSYMQNRDRTHDELVDGLLKTWMFAVLVLGGGAFAAQVLGPQLMTSFVVAGASAPLLTQGVLASLAYIWLLPVLALAGYLLRRRRAGSVKAHVVGVRVLLGVGMAWLLIAVCGFLLLLL